MHVRLTAFLAWTGVLHTRSNQILSVNLCNPLLEFLMYYCVKQSMVWYNTNCSPYGNSSYLYVNWSHTWYTLFRDFTLIRNGMELWQCPFKRLHQLSNKKLKALIFVFKPENKWENSPSFLGMELRHPAERVKQTQVKQTQFSRRKKSRKLSLQVVIFFSPPPIIYMPDFLPPRFFLSFNSVTIFSLHVSRSYFAICYSIYTSDGHKNKNHKNANCRMQ